MSDGFFGIPFWLVDHLPPGEVSFFHPCPEYPDGYIHIGHGTNLTDLVWRINTNSPADQRFLQICKVSPK
jgi:hypothetical protein